MRFHTIAALLLSTTPALAAPVDDGAAIAIAKPQVLIVDRSLAPGAVAAMLKPVEAFYGFWNIGSQALLDQAISPNFTDRALPPGRPQGPKGPMVAAKAFLGAVPDLRCTIPQRLVVGDRVVSHLHFTGHFTGSFQGTKGMGQTIDFIAIDALHEAGRSREVTTLIAAMVLVMRRLHRRVSANRFFEA